MHFFSQYMALFLIAFIVPGFITAYKLGLILTNLAADTKDIKDRFKINQDLDLNAEINEFVNNKVNSITPLLIVSSFTFVLAAVAVYSRLVGN